MLETIYEVEDWLPDYRFAAPVTHFGREGYAVEAGDVFRTHCTYLNNGETELSYPDEMCTTFGVAFPLEEPIRCEAGGAQGHSWGKGEGTLEGVIRRTPNIPNDGIGELVVAVFPESKNGPNGPGAPVATWLLEEADLSEADSEVEFRLEGVPVGEGPLYVFVLVDDDGNGIDEGPSSGDLLDEAHGVIVPTTAPVSIDFLLEVVP